jgi:hypothetical protein
MHTRASRRLVPASHSRSWLKSARALQYFVHLPAIALPDLLTRHDDLKPVILLAQEVLHDVRRTCHPSKLDLSLMSSEIPQTRETHRLQPLLNSPSYGMSPRLPSEE